MRSLFAVLVVMLMSGPVFAAKPTKVKAQFYDFGNQLIDGKIQKATVIYTGAVERARFGRLLRLKKSFMSHIHQSGKASLFK
ncbi:MAG TPA: hypothetical protein EYN06_03320 [Myxococcales bacterium]|nr:hypothetical protein [Myxococcales bacterium]HIN85487.1 hypothetical protein [Myxococcales bacterium]